MGKVEYDFTQYSDDQIEAIHWQTGLPQKVVTHVVEVVKHDLPVVEMDLAKSVAFDDFKFMAEGDAIGPRAYILIKSYVENRLSIIENEMMHDDLFDQDRKHVATRQAIEFACFLTELDKIFGMEN